MIQTYRHRQMGYAILFMALSAEAGLLAACVRYQKGMAALLFTLLILFLAASLFMLEVRVDEKAVRLKFGIGLIRKEILLDGVRACTRMRSSLLSGWGIRNLKRGAGWFYSVSGFDAVELSLKNGQFLRIGTDDPDGLGEAIRKGISRDLAALGEIFPESD